MDESLVMAAAVRFFFLTSIQRKVGCLQYFFSSTWWAIENEEVVVAIKLFRTCKSRRVVTTDNEDKRKRIRENSLKCAIRRSGYNNHVFIIQRL